MNRILSQIAIFSAMMQACICCEEVIENPSGENVPALLIVEGLITDEDTIHTVSLTTTVGLNYEGVAPPVSNAQVTISDGTNTFGFVETSRAGTYAAVQKFRGVPGKAYTLNVTVDNKHYTATDTMPQPPILPELEFRQDPDLHAYIWSVPNEHTLAPGTTYENNVTFLHAGLASAVTEITYYNFTGLDASTLFDLNQRSQDIIFKPGTTIVQRRYGLSANYYRFLKAVLLETEWKGGLYDPTASNVPTNLSAGASGYFRASSVSTRTMMVN